MSDTANMVIILERLAIVERDNIILKRAAIGVLVLVAGTLFVGAAMPKNEVIEAKQFVVKDESGRMRAALGYNEMGPALVLFGADGKLGVSLSSASDASGLSVFDTAGRPRAGLTCGASGYPGLTLMSQAGIVRATLGCSETARGIPLLAFMDEAGNPIYSVPRY